MANVQIPTQGTSLQHPAYPHRPPSRVSSSGRSQHAPHARYGQSPLHAYGHDQQYQHYTPTVPSHGQYPRYATDADHGYRQPVNDQNTYFVPSNSQVHPHGPGYGQPQWNEAQMTGSQLHPHGLGGNTYGNSYSGSTPSMPVLRGTSAHSMGHGHPDPSQSYTRCAINPFVTAHGMPR